MINYEDYFGDLTEEEYKEQTREHFEWLRNNMRDATYEERQSIQKYIDTISIPTGINFYDFVKTSSPCDNCANNIKNGGNGICHCILGQIQFT